MSDIKENITKKTTFTHQKKLDAMRDYRMVGKLQESGKAKKKVDHQFKFFKINFA